MAKQKISNLAKELNVGLPNIFEFLRKNNIDVPESPNTRVEESVAEMLTHHFQPDREIKTRSDQQTNDRMQSRAAAREKNAEAARPAAPELALTPSDMAQKPRILGKIELDAKGNPVVVKAAKEEAPAKEETPAPAPAPAPAPEKKQEDKPAEPEKPVKAETPAPAPVKEEEKPAAVRKETPAPAPEKKQESKPAEPEKPAAVGMHPGASAPEKQEEKPAPAPDVPEAAAAPAAPAEPEVFTLGTAPRVQGPVVVGKIDLAAINANTRPKKKSKEERRNERKGQNGENAGGESRRKRSRISGGQKVDIEKAGRQAASEGDRQRRGQGGGNQGQNQQNQRQPRNQGGKKRQAAPVVPEVSEEDVSKQVKETLARLTSKDKGLKKGAKWRKEKRDANAARAEQAHLAEEAESRTLKLTEFVTANDLAIMMDVPINQVIATCMNIGVMVSINQRLDAETINIVAEEFGFTTEYVSTEVANAIHQEEDSEDELEARPPIVTVMGHVDHGKTSLLDYIRKANVIAGEAGGITQHIGSYSVKLPDGRHITFLDTPGHEAFTAMRARGAKVTDLAIIIVAADDDVMPQTIEAINHASAAGVPMVFAINKIDKPTANPDKIKEELANMNYLVEDWGGKYQSQDISAKKGIGVDELMEKVLLEAEMLDLKANPERKAIGSVIESSLDKGRGYVATVLVQNGTLRMGDVILAGTHYGKVKAMFNERNQRVTEAGPATPVLILGLNGAPQAGDTFNVLDTEQEAREIAGKREQLQRELGLRTKKRPGLEELGRRRALNDFHELNLVVKGDVDGSVEALSDSLLKLSTPEIQVNVLHKGVGAISESDVTLAAASDAIIIGFQVRPSATARKEAEKEGVEIRLYSVIYKAIEEVKDAMEGLLSPEIKEEITGNAEVLQTYHISKVGTIAGAIVRDGKIKRTSKVRVIRDGIVIYTGELGSLKRFKDDVKEVVSGYDCGLSIQGYNDIREGDIIEAFEEVEVKKTL